MSLHRSPPVAFANHIWHQSWCNTVIYRISVRLSLAGEAAWNRNCPMGEIWVLRYSLRQATGTPAGRAPLPREEAPGPRVSGGIWGRGAGCRSRTAGSRSPRPGRGCAALPADGRGTGEGLRWLSLLAPASSPVRPAMEAAWLGVKNHLVARSGTKRTILVWCTINFQDDRWWHGRKPPLPQEHFLGCSCSTSATSPMLTVLSSRRPLHTPALPEHLQACGTRVPHHPFCHPLKGYGSRFARRLFSWEVYPYCGQFWFGCPAMPAMCLCQSAPFGLGRVFHPCSSPRLLEKSAPSKSCQGGCDSRAENFLENVIYTPIKGAPYCIQSFLLLYTFLNL